MFERPAWQREGQEPDYRFSLANERTFLAWIRTALALLAGGVALDQFAVALRPRGLVIAIAVGLSMLAAMLCAFAYRNWRVNETAMRHARPLPGAPAILLLSVCLACGGGVLAALLLWRS
jgi:putative membrane protein